MKSLLPFFPVKKSVQKISVQRTGYPTVKKGEKNPLRVLTFTTLFPNAQFPLHGLFVRERVKRMAQLCDMQVVAPVPWTPPLQLLGERYYRYSQVDNEEYQENLIVKHPRFLVFPRIGKAIDGILLAACSLGSVRTGRRTFPFDVIDAHWAYPDGVAAALLARIFRVPFSLTVRGDDINIFSQQAGRRPSIRWALRKAELVIALSTELKQRVEDLGVPASRVVVIGNGVDTERFHPRDRMEARRRLGLRDNGPLILSVGRVHFSKGHHILVEALGRLQTAIPNLRVAIVGESDQEADARHLIWETAQKYGVSNRVELVGPRPPDDLPNWYAAADLFCLPTLREGSANVILEALACGLPCITTPVGSNPEVLSCSEIGLLVPPEAANVAEAIAQGLSKVWDKQRIAAYAGKRTWTTVAQECCVCLSRIVDAQRIRQ